MKKKIGIFLIVFGIAMFILILSGGGFPQAAIFNLFFLGGIGFLMIRSANKKQREIEEENKKSRKIESELNIKRKKEIKDKSLKVDKLKIQLLEIQEIHVPDISDYKKAIIANEKNIIDKGSDNQLFLFMKIDSFLNDYRATIINDQIGLKDILDVNFIKSRIKKEINRDDLDKIIENLSDVSAKLEGRRTKGFEANIEELFELGKVVKPALKNQIKTMDFYRDMALAMIVFYLNDNKIRYFEIYEAFEKLGVFDSTWQKNVLNKLDRIEFRLAQISNQLTELNQNFISLIESSKNIAAELKEIKSSIVTSNLLQAITAYQAWKINKNTK